MNIDYVSAIQIVVNVGLTLAIVGKSSTLLYQWGKSEHRVETLERDTNAAHSKIRANSDEIKILEERLLLLENKK